MRFSAHLNLLFNDEPFADRIKHVATAGFDGFEVYGFNQNLDALIEKRDKYDLEWAYLSGNRPDFTNPQQQEAAIDSIKRSLQIANQVDCEYVNVKSGSEQDHLDSETQRQSVIEILRKAAPLAEEYGITLVLEPLNTTVDHPGHFTNSVEEGIDIVSSVDSPWIKVLFDFYHEQVSNGDIIRTFRNSVEYIGHIHIADNPGRHEPGTGEINYSNVFTAIQNSSYDGYIGCEFIPTSEPIHTLSATKDLV